jgi:hypothetical protein
MKSSKWIIPCIVLVTLALLAVASAQAGPLGQQSEPQSEVGAQAGLGTGFTYQGQLKLGGESVTDDCSMAFRLYDQATAGSQVGSAITHTVPISDGLFAVNLDFGAVFTGDARWLGIKVKCGGDGGYADLGRQELTATPYALHALGAPWSGLSGVPAGFADGIDDDTTYSAGNQLNLVGNTFDVTEGAGSGLDADLLDGQHGSHYLDWGNLTNVPADLADGDDDTTYSAGNQLNLAGNTFNVTEGAGSGLDADLLDGQHGSHYLDWGNLANVPADLADGDDDTTYTAGEGLALSGTEFSAQGSAYDNVVIVAKSGGDFTSIQSALDSITDASASNRYLVWVGPGTYAETVAMAQYVDIEGAGELTTRITASGSTTYTTSTVVGVNNAELRFLTVENSGGNQYAVAIYNHNASPRLTHVTASASGASGGSAQNYGVYNDSSSPAMTDMTVAVSASGTTWNYGVRNSNGSLPTMMNVTISVSGGGYSGSSYGVYNKDSSPAMKNVTASAVNNYGNYGVANDSSSPTMENVTAVGSGGGFYNIGVSNVHSSSPTMENVTASGGSGGMYARGVFNGDSSSPTMVNVIATASGGSLHNRGVWNDSSSPTIQNSTISASGASSSGIYNEATSGSYTVQVNNCQITGGTNTIRNDAEFTTLVGASLLDGGTVNANGGTVTCAGAYDEAYTFYASTCP